MRKYAAHALRIALTAAFLVLVFFMIDFEDRDVARFSDGSTKVLAPGEEAPPGAVVERREGFLSLVERMDRTRAAGLAALFLLPIGLTALRWWLLMRAAGLPAPLGRVAAVSYAGTFFNLFLPGAVGGDIAKAVLATQGEERKAAIVGTVVLDRIVGLVMMVVLAVAASLSQIGRPELRPVVIAVMAMFGGFLALYLAYFSPRLRSTRFGTWLKGRLPFVSVVREIDGVFRSAVGKRGVLASACLLSIVAQVATIVLIFGLARAIGIGGVPFHQFLVFEPLLFIISAIPISLGGWGVGEYAYVRLFGIVGVPPHQAIALSVLAKLAVMAASLPGGIIFALGLAGRRRDR